MATTNDITGDVIATKVNSPVYKNRFEWAFCKDENHLCGPFEDKVHECPSCGMRTTISFVNGKRTATVVS